MAACAGVIGPALPSAFPATAGAVPLHTENWAYADGCNGGVGASAAVVRAWVTYAENNCGEYGLQIALGLCHAGGIAYCAVMQYVDTAIVYRRDPPGNLIGATSPSWVLHEPAPDERDPITVDAYGGGYVMNQEKPAYQTWWRRYIDANYSGVDGLFMDDQSPLLPLFHTSSPFSSEAVASAPAVMEPLVVAESRIQTARLTMSEALTGPDGSPYPQIDNTVPDCGNPFEGALGLGPTGNMIAGPVIGLAADACPEVYGALRRSYPDFLDDIAYVEDETPGALVMISYGCAGAASQLRSRLIDEATELLGYAPGRLVDWPALEQTRPDAARCPGYGNDLAVWPESGIYPTFALQTMGAPVGPACLVGDVPVSCPVGGHNDLQAPGAPAGVFRREFGRCYNQSVPFGPCAAIVNTTPRPVTVRRRWLVGRYRFEITTVGGDVQSGGFVDLTGRRFRPGRSTIAPDSAILLAEPNLPGAWLAERPHPAAALPDPGPVLGWPTGSVAP
jgi:hypothetical protein